ncbi:MAG: type II toxin-antitoxin system RelE/ParE family toxin [Clostridia bacterium]|nr:type II toxin-antitoxin system RelE/ParE family toxin [Clostridia bacterium]
MADKFDYNFTQKAVQDLEEILHYISVELSNSQAAARLNVHIFQSIDMLRSFPDMGAIVDNEFIKDKTVRKVIVGHFILYYKNHYDAQSITILRILYGRRNLNEILQSF